VLCYNSAILHNCAHAAAMFGRGPTSQSAASAGEAARLDDLGFRLAWMLIP
jgi:hypothetical protein